MIDDILLQVNKPGRYIGREWNVPAKEFKKAGVRFALVFPDLYEVGMSNLGIRIIYGLLNSIDDVSCERFFSCEPDMENILRKNSLGNLSLETASPFREFDIAGFSLGSELDYTNVLNILDLNSVPLESRLRENSHPLIIAGGPCVLNPEPMHEFFDLFIIGEAEEAVLELIGLYREHQEEFKQGALSRQELLLLLAQVEGVYAPSLYEVKYNAEGKIEEFRPKVEGAPLKIKKRFAANFDSAFFPLEWLVPYIQIIHDRVTLEVMRGCPNSCRFCQARSCYYPLREKKAENLLKMAQELCRRTGYEEISLSGLSVSDYSQVQELICGLVGLFKEKGVAVSLPSIKPGSAVGGFSSLIAGTKKTGLTFAPEAGTVRLRNVLGKDFREGDFFSGLSQAYAAGYQHVKLYFMLGLPSEREEDLEAIIDFAQRVSNHRKNMNPAPARVNISINALIPKPHTPMQWFAMEGPAAIKEKQDYLKNRAKNRRLVFSFHNRDMSFLEGVLSRGDRRLSRVILAAFKQGARFDAWGNRFSFEKWRSAFQECGIDPCLYLEERSRAEFLPWDFIDVGISKRALAEEFNKILAQI